MKNHFHILGIAESFVLDAAQLEQIYFRKQQEFHPDRQAGKGAAEKQKAILASMDINQAYQTLKSPLKRAQHLLELQNIVVNTDGRDTVKPSPELLMEMMTLREEVAECNSAALWENLSNHVTAEHQLLLEKLASLFTHQAYHEAALQIIRLRYLEKTEEELRLIKKQKNFE